MINNRTICKQVDITDDDLNIFLGLNLMCEPRKYDRQDFEIMRARTNAINRGASSVEIQNSIMLYQDNKEV